MTNNNTPTAPGWWWIKINKEPEVVQVVWSGNKLYYFRVNDEEAEPAYQTCEWLGPVPMPGEWVSLDEHEAIIERLWVAESGINPQTGTMWLTPRMMRESEATQ